MAYQPCQEEREKASLFLAHSARLERQGVCPLQRGGLDVANERTSLLSVQIERCTDTHKVGHLLLTQNNDATVRKRGGGGRTVRTHRRAIPIYRSIRTMCTAQMRGRRRVNISSSLAERTRWRDSNGEGPAGREVKSRITALGPLT